MSITTEQVVIAGARPSKGEVEGNPYDFTELYIQQSLNPENARGVATVPYKYGKSDNYHQQFEKLPNASYPIKAEADFLSITNGRGAVTRVITAVRPVAKAN